MRANSSEPLGISPPSLGQSPQAPLYVVQIHRRTSLPRMNAVDGMFGPYNGSPAHIVATYPIKHTYRIALADCEREAFQSELP